jgi:single-strand DNA-binding protein
MHNTIVAIGHLTADPTSQQTSTGKTICRMRMCISDSNSKNKCFIDIECWEKTAEVCLKFLKKGREIFLEGELCTSSWQGKDGSQQHKNFIKASRVKFLGSGRKDEGATQASPATASTVDQDPSDDIPF